MRTTIFLLAALAALAAASAHAATLDEALAAFRNHDYASAYDGLSPLAAQGNAMAESLLGLMYVQGLGVK
jgi:TPR repeat protein